MNIGDIVINRNGGERCLVVNTFGTDSVVLRSLEFHSLADFVAPISVLAIAKPYKPLWKDAPSWARYLAMDASGVWTWYENLPKEFEDAYVSDGGKVLADGYSYYWENSLEGRRAQEMVEKQGEVT